MESQSSTSKNPNVQSPHKVSDGNISDDSSTSSSITQVLSNKSSPSSKSKLSDITEFKATLDPKFLQIQINDLWDDLLSATQTIQSLMEKWIHQFNCWNKKLPPKSAVGRNSRSVSVLATFTPHSQTWQPLIRGKIRPAISQKLTPLPKVWTNKQTIWLALWHSHFRPRIQWSSRPPTSPSWMQLCTYDNIHTSSFQLYYSLHFSERKLNQNSKSDQVPTYAFNRINTVPIHDSPSGNECKYPSPSYQWKNPWKH